VEQIEVVDVEEAEEEVAEEVVEGITTIGITIETIKPKKHIHSKTLFHHCQILKHNHGFQEAHLKYTITHQHHLHNSINPIHHGDTTTEETIEEMIEEIIVTIGETIVVTTIERETDLGASLLTNHQRRRVSGNKPVR
jgi:translation elongation factor EF-Ts